MAKMGRLRFIAMAGFNRILSPLAISLFLLSGCAHSGVIVDNKSNYIFSYEMSSFHDKNEPKMSIEILAPKDWTGEKANDILLLSAAKVALKNGYSYFIESSRKKFWHYARTNMKIYICAYKNKPEVQNTIVYNAEEIEHSFQGKYETPSK